MLKRPSSGFSLIELIVAVSIMGILTAAAMPSFTTWINNSRARGVADALQSGLRLAQGEAQRRTHTVVFFLTNAKTCTNTATAAAGGAYWQIRTIPLLAEDTVEAVQCGVLTDISTGITLTPSANASALCFSGDGRQVAVTDPTGIGLNCTATAATYTVTPGGSSSEKRPLRVTVSLAGSVRMCDPGKSSTAPDGCR